MLVDVDIGDIEKDQDALEGLLRYAGVPEKWIKLTSAAYLAKTACNNAQKELFDRVFQPMKLKS